MNLSYCNMPGNAGISASITYYLNKKHNELWYFIFILFILYQFSKKMVCTVSFHKNRRLFKDLNLETLNSDAVFQVSYKKLCFVTQ